MPTPLEGAGMAISRPPTMAVLPPSTPSPACKQGRRPEQSAINGGTAMVFRIRKGTAREVPKVLRTSGSQTRGPQNSSLRQEPNQAEFLVSAFCFFINYHQLLQMLPNLACIATYTFLGLCVNHGGGPNQWCLDTLVVVQWTTWKLLFPRGRGGIPRHSTR